MIITARGRLGRDPKEIQTRSGKGMATTAMAVDLKVAQSEDYGTCWVKIVCFGRLAESLLSCSKGSIVSVAGRVQLERWQTKDGAMREDLTIIADSIMAVEIHRPAAAPRQDGPAQREELGESRSRAQNSNTTEAIDDDLPF